MARTQTTRTVHHEVAALAGPIVASMLSFTAMGLVDTLFVGRLGTGPLAAVALGHIAAWLPMSFGAGLLTGTKTLVAQSIGAGDARAARVFAWQGLWLAGGLGAIAAVASLSGPWLLPALGAEASWLGPAQDYFDLRLMGAPVFFAGLALNGWFHGTGSPRPAMIATLLGNAVNIALDPLFIFGWGPVPAMGAGGAGLATALGFAASGAFLMARAWPALRAAPGGLDGRALRRTASIGGPAGGRMLLEVGSFLLFAAILARAGEVALAAHVLVIRIVSVSFLPGHAIGEAASVLVGQAVGALDPARARATWRSAGAMALGLMGAFGLLFLSAPGLLLAPFEPAADLAAAAASLLAIAALFQVFDAVAMVGLGALSGAGDTRFVMLASVACAWLVKLPLGYVLALPMGLGAAGAWIGLTAEIALVAVLCVGRLQGRAWLGPAAEAAGRTRQPQPGGA